VRRRTPQANSDREGHRLRQCERGAAPQQDRWHLEDDDAGLRTPPKRKGVLGHRNLSLEQGIEVLADYWREHR